MSRLHPESDLRVYLGLVRRPRRRFTLRDPAVRELCIR